MWSNFALGLNLPSFLSHYYILVLTDNNIFYSLLSYNHGPMSWNKLCFWRFFCTHSPLPDVNSNLPSLLHTMLKTTLYICTVVPVIIFVLSFNILLGRDGEQQPVFLRIAVPFSNFSCETHSDSSLHYNVH